METKLRFYNIDVKARAAARPWPDLSHSAGIFKVYISENELIARPGAKEETMDHGKDRRTACGRRRILKLLGGLAASAGLGGLFAGEAQAKTSQAAAAYRASPNGRQSCANCSWFQAPAGCGVVRGPVSARGWCNLWG
jgi:hypothetical protein